MHTEGITYNKQHYFKLSSDFFDSQSSLLSVMKARLAHTKQGIVLYTCWDYYACDLWPWDLCASKLVMQ